MEHITFFFVVSIRKKNNHDFYFHVSYDFSRCERSRQLVQGRQTSASVQGLLSRTFLRAGLAAAVRAVERGAVHGSRERVRLQADLVGRFST